jgi:peptidoglycan hydrolase-like protein with peptidoglycan-binding domain
MWYNIAAIWGHDRAALARTRLESRMTGRQIAAARTKAENWQPDPRQAGDTSLGFTVRNAQMMLNRAGYAAGPEDGIMGTKTRLAIRSFQRDRGLNPDGQLTQNLFGRMVTDAGGGSVAVKGDDRVQLVSDLQSELRRRGYAIPLVTGEVNDATRQAIWAYQQDSGLTVNGQPSESLLARLRSSQGNDRQETARLVHATQSRLNDLGYNAGPEDGVYGPTTRSAVREFQSDQGLPMTGEASTSLLARIQQATGESADKDQRHVQMVLATQKALEARGYSVGAVDGKVTPQTTAAVRTYQSDAGIAINGRIDGDLLQRLEQNQEQAAGMTHGEIVQEIQRSLNQRGYKAGPSDGVFGPGTRTAILTYQSDAGLPQTGEASRHLLRHLQGSDITAGAGVSEAQPRSQHIQQLKAELNRLGYHVGAEDGVFEDRTRQGILAFQKDIRVEQTGEPSPVLLAQLQNSYRVKDGTNDSEVIQGIAAYFINRLSNPQ